MSEETGKFKVRNKWHVNATILEQLNQVAQKEAKTPEDVISDYLETEDGSCAEGHPELEKILLSIFAAYVGVGDRIKNTVVIGDNEIKVEVYTNTPTMWAVGID